VSFLDDIAPGVKTPFFMAPLEGITDIPFRKIVRKHGCHVICTQMIHAQALLRGKPEKMFEVAALDPAEQPVGMQLCGNEAGLIAEAARKAEQMGAAFIDLNMGCPAPNVVSSGSGAALLKDPAKAGSIISETVNAVRVPVTVKIRAGWDDQYRTAPEIGPIVEKEGAKLLTVHARTRAQRFKGAADWSLIKALKDRLSIPVVGNGDVFSFEDARQMVEETGADGVMAARGALGNPWIFSGHKPTTREVKETLLEHLDLHLSFYPRREYAMMTFRKHIVWYTKGLRESAEFRRKLFQERDPEATMRMLRDYFDGLEADA